MTIKQEIKKDEMITTMLDNNYPEAWVLFLVILLKRKAKTLVTNGQSTTYATMFWKLEFTKCLETISIGKLKKIKIPKGVVRPRKYYTTAFGNLSSDFTKIFQKKFFIFFEKTLDNLTRVCYNKSVKRKWR